MNKKLKYFLIALGVVVAIAAGILAKAIFDVKNTAEKIHTPVGDEPVVKIEKKQPFSVLLLGVDEREGDKGRSDTMIVLTVNPNDKSTKMLSIPRDTYVEIVGRDKMDKINHAYAFGGIEMSKATVEKFLDMDIDYVVQVNMEGFKDLVDIVGPITVNNERAFSQDGYSFKEGSITLNGTQALSYVRMRKQDPEGDFGRQNRQRQVIEASVKKMISMKSVLNYNKILKVAGNNVRTNMTMDDILNLRDGGYSESLNTVTQLYFKKGKGTTIDKIYYYIADEEELEQIKQELKSHVGQ